MKSIQNSVLRQLRVWVSIGAQPETLLLESTKIDTSVICPDRANATDMDVPNAIRNTLLALTTVLLVGGYLITVIPAGPNYQVTAEVTSRTSRSGPTGNIGILICELENGNRITVDLPPVATVQTGDRVVLSSYDRYLLKPKYSFSGKLIEGQD